MSGRTVSLRKCPDHDDCQLQQVNDGEWEHTPRRTSLAARLAPPLPDRAKLEDEAAEVTARARTAGAAVANAAARADHILRQVAARRLELDDLRAQLERRMPDTLAGIEDRGARLAEIAEGLSGTVNALAERAGNVQRLERVDELWSAVEEARSEWQAAVAALSSRLDDLERRVKHERTERLQSVEKQQRTNRNIVEMIERKDRQ